MALAISLKSVFVIFCVVLTLVTALLTLSVSLSFSHKAAQDIGVQYCVALATSLKNDVTNYLQDPVDGNAAAARVVGMQSTGTPNTTWSPTWNGSYWTFNPADLINVQPYVAMSVAKAFADNFTRTVSGFTCFQDGTFITISPLLGYGMAFALLTITAGRGDPPGTPSALYGNVVALDSQGAPLTPLVVAPQYGPGCNPALGCVLSVGLFECRLLVPSVQSMQYGRRQCFWVPRYVAIWPVISTGIYCTLFNVNGVRLGVVGAQILLTAITQLILGSQRTPNSQAFVIDWPNERLLGSTYSQPYQFAWMYINATYDSAANALRNSTPGPIVTIPQAGTAATIASVLGGNASFIPLRPGCGNGELGVYIVCQESVLSLGFEPLKALRGAVGLDPALGSRSGVLQSDGSTYYYAVASVQTLLEGSLVPGLECTVAVLTPDGDVVGKVNKGANYSIVAACCFFVFAAVCCYLSFTVFLRPLSELEDRMLLTANLADEDDASNHESRLTEVRNMQRSFYRLRTQLRKLKSYVPQSVLAALDDDDDEGPAAKSIISSGIGSAKSEEGRSEVQTTPSTKRSARSSSNSVVTGSGIVVRALNMQVGLAKKFVSILVFNVVGLHAHVKEQNFHDVAALHSKLVESFQRVILQGKGIVDSFQGDRFVATFNAVTSNAQHAVRACVAAKEMLAGFQQVRGNLLRAGIGIASGEALVGNAGSDTMKRFCTIGRVYTQATVMERLTKQHATADVIISQATAGQVGHEFYMEALDVISLEGLANPALVFALRDRMNHAMEEWNYAMEQNEARDKYSKANEAFGAYADGDASAARALLNSVPQESQSFPGVSRLMDLLNRNVFAPQHSETAQGVFFATSFGGCSRESHVEEPERKV